MDATEVVRLLQEDPETLLRQVHIRITGDAVTPSGRHHFLVYNEGATTKGFQTGLSGKLGKTKDRPQFRIYLQRAAVVDPMVAGKIGGAPSVYAQYIAMRQDSETSATTHRMLPSTGGPDLMLTVRLDGCTFGIGSDANNNRLVSHIQPNPGKKTDKTQQRADLTTAINRGFSGGAESTFGRGAGYGYQSNIIGVRRAGVWKIFAQVVEVLPIDKVGNVGAQIVSVDRLL